MRKLATKNKVPNFSFFHSSRRDLTLFLALQGMSSMTSLVPGHRNRTSSSWAPIALSGWIHVLCECSSAESQSMGCGWVARAGRSRHSEWWLLCWGCWVGVRDYLRVNWGILTALTNPQISVVQQKSFSLSPVQGYLVWGLSWYLFCKQWLRDPAFFPPSLCLDFALLSVPRSLSIQPLGGKENGGLSVGAFHRPDFHPLPIGQNQSHDHTWLQRRLGNIVYLGTQEEKGH